ncbi:MAG TPA: ABC transporter substrate-binding protein [Natronosporangium sp.]
MRRTLFAVATTVALLLAGCGGSEEPETPTDPTAEAGFPVTVGDLTLESRPTRIVSLSPTVTEMLFAIGAGEQVVAVDELSNYPPEAPVTELSGFEINVEAVAEYDPDLVIISSYPEVIEQFEPLGIPVHLAPDNPTTIEDVYTQITDLGALTGRPDEAADLVTRMRDDLAKLVADVPDREQPLRYYIEIDDTYWTYTSDSLIGSLFAMVGLANIAGEQGAVSVQLTAEEIIDSNPDVIFLMNAAFGMTPEQVAARAGWADIEAVRNDRIVALDTDVASRWGPRLVDLMATVVDTVSQIP